MCHVCAGAPNLKEIVYEAEKFNSLLELAKEVHLFGKETVTIFIVHFRFYNFTAHKAKLHTALKAILEMA